MHGSDRTERLRLVEESTVGANTLSHSVSLPHVLRCGEGYVSRTQSRRVRGREKPVSRRGEVVMKTSVGEKVAKIQEETAKQSFPLQYNCDKFHVVKNGRSSFISVVKYIYATNILCLSVGEVSLS